MNPFRSPALLAALMIAPAAMSAQQDSAAQKCTAAQVKTTESVDASPAAEALTQGNELLTRGAAADALDAFEASERLAREADRPDLALRARASAARAAVAAEGRGDAGSRLERTSKQVDSLESPRERAALRIHLARSWALLGQRHAQARQTARARGAQALQEAAADAETAGDERLRSYALGYLAAYYEEEGRREEALVLTRRALFAAQQADAPDAGYRWHWQIGRLQLAAGDRAAALASYRRAVTALADIRAQLATGAEGAAAFRTSVKPLYIGLVELLLTRSGESQGDAQQALLAEARDTLEDLKAAELRDYFRDPCLDALRKASPDVIPRTLVVYPVALPDRLELIVGESGRLERYTVPVDAETFAAEVLAFRNLLEKRTTRQYLRPARRLYDWLIRPLEPALEGREIDTLVFVPDGLLRSVPLAALQDRESKQYLIERYALAITPSLTLTDPRPIDRGSVRLLAAGISESVQGYPALEAVAQEMAAVSAAFPGEQLMNDSFRAARFGDAVTERPFGIIHIASHGEFSADSAESYVLAYDGKMSMDQLADWIATTRFRTERPLELLTLSACQTAAGDERAALGLAGVALRAGARSALATLWSVHDRASAELISEFYTQLRNPERSRADALRTAQIKIMRTHHFRHPGYWSPFVLISSWL
ncbi:MAG: CHAT domain-containing protein [Myxococcales bacterium]|nr:CHAT domain-containing protein [Myxococcales bacterium]